MDRAILLETWGEPDRVYWKCTQRMQHEATADVVLSGGPCPNESEAVHEMVAEFLKAYDGEG